MPRSSVLLLGLLLVACVDTEPASPAADAGAAGATSSHETHADAGHDADGQADAATKPAQPEEPEHSGIGAAQCTEDSVCPAIVESEFSSLVDPPYPRDYHKAVCLRGEIYSEGSAWGGDVGTPSCLCGEGGAVVLLSSSSPLACLWSGRAARCLYRTKEFPGCDLSQADTSCTAVCADLQTRVDADAARVVEASIRSAFCETYTCQGIAQIDGACFALGSQLPQSCSLSDEAILATAKAARDKANQIPDCRDRDADGGPGLCVESGP